MWGFAFNEVAGRSKGCTMDDDKSLIPDDVDEDDPFLLFDEWASPADVEAFDTLMLRE